MTETAASNSPIGLLFVTALPKEEAAVKQFFSNCREVRHGNGEIFHVGAIELKGNWYAAAVIHTGADNVNAAAATQQAISLFSPRIAMFVGIAGTLKPKDVGIGDVIASSKVYYYEKTKETDQGTKNRPEQWPATTNLVRRAEIEAPKPDWLKTVHKVEPGANCRAMVGIIASGESVHASKKSAEKKRILDNFNDAQAIEMEGYGFGNAVERNVDVWGIVIRGICDKATADKDDTFQFKAASRAAAFAIHLLEFFTDRAGPPLPSGAKGIADIVNDDGKLTPIASKQAFDAMMLRAWQQINAGRLGDAEGRLLELKFNHFAHATSMDKYLWAKALSLVLRRTGRVPEGAQLLYDYAVAEPDLEVQADAAYALYMLNRSEEGFAIATRCVEERPDSERAWFAFVLNAFGRISRDQLLSRVPTPMKEVSKVQLALASFFSLLADSENAEQWAVRASGDKTQLRACFIAGSAIIRSLDVTRNEDGSYLISSPERAREAIDWFGKEIERCKALGADRDAIDSYLGRSNILLLLGNPKDAQADLIVAGSLDPTNPSIQRELARRAVNEGKVDEAIKLLEGLAVLEATRDDNFATISLAIQRSKSADVAVADSGIAALTALSAPLKSKELDVMEYQSLLEALIAALARNGRLKDARARSPADTSRCQPWFVASIQSQLLRLEGNLEEARAVIAVACESVKGSPRKFDKLHIARCAYDVGLWEQSLAMFKEVIDPLVLTSDVRKMIRAAERLHDYEFVLKTCKHLRANSVLDHALVEREIGLLSTFKPTEAYAIASEISAKAPMDRLYYLLRGLAADKAGKLDEIHISADKLPTTSEAKAHPSMIGAAIYLLKKTNQWTGHSICLRAISAAT